MKCINEDEKSACNRDVNMKNAINLKTVQTYNNTLMMEWVNKNIYWNFRMNSKLDVLRISPARKFFTAIDPALIFADDLQLKRRMMNPESFRNFS